MGDDGRHRLAERLLSLLDSVDEPSGLLDLVLEEGEGLSALS